MKLLGCDALGRIFDSASKCIPKIVYSAKLVPDSYMCYTVGLMQLWLNKDGGSHICLWGYHATSPQSIGLLIMFEPMIY